MKKAKYRASGIIERKRDNTGIFTEKNSKIRYFVNRRQMRNVFDGDVVFVEIKKKKKSVRDEIEIIGVEKRKTKQILGTFGKKNNEVFIVPIGKGFGKKIPVDKLSAGDPQIGQIVLCEIDIKFDRENQFFLNLIEIWGFPDAFGIESRVQIFKYKLPFEFSDDVRSICSNYSPDLLKKEIKYREDLRGQDFITVDGEDAKDFDDAVFCTKEVQGYSLKVAIADVDFFVEEGNALDLAARERGTSIYFPRSVLPMLPEELSNNLCSLKPNCERLVLVCDMMVDKDGRINKYKFYQAIIESKARITYHQFDKIIRSVNGKKADLKEGVLANVNNLFELYKIFAQARNRRGGLAFSSTEATIKFNKQNYVECIGTSQKYVSHGIVEEAMLAANLCAADFTKKTNSPNIYRVHEVPSDEKITRLARELQSFGVEYNFDQASPKEYQALLSLIKSHPQASLIQIIVMQSLERAFYSSENSGHFGLAYEAYTHFTSPIRRYPDLVCHRIIKSLLLGREGEFDKQVSLGGYLSSREQLSDSASRDALSWCKCLFMSRKVGETFSGIISGVREFGIFVTLDKYPVDGLVHISQLGSDYYHYDEIKCQIHGERGLDCFSLGDKLLVKVTKVNIEQSQIDFDIE